MLSMLLHTPIPFSVSSRDDLIPDRRALGVVDTDAIRESLLEFNGVVPDRRFDPRVSGVVRRQDDRLEQDRLRGSHRRA